MLPKIGPLKVRKLNPTAKLPTYESDSASGLDLYYCGDEFVIIPGDRALAGTGIAIELPDGYEGQIRPRSGLALRKGLTVLNAPGTIDNDYRGEISVILHNTDIVDMDITIRPGDRIAQLVIAPVVQVSEVQEANLSDTTRGEGGFGSTGSR